MGDQDVVCPGGDPHVRYADDDFHDWSDKRSFRLVMSRGRPYSRNPGRRQAVSDPWRTTPCGAWSPAVARHEATNGSAGKRQGTMQNVLCQGQVFCTSNLTKKKKPATNIKKKIML